MAQSRKYATLPDLDSAPDTYETPELTEDNSTIAGSTIPRSSSPESTRNLGDESTSDIDRERLHPDQARSHFSPAEVDATDVDFSDRVTSKRKSYRASSRRRRKVEDGTEELGEFADDEDESLERKFARLRREVQEVKEEFDRQGADDKKVSGSEDSIPKADDILALGDILDQIRSPQGHFVPRAEAELAKNLAKGLQTSGEVYSESIMPQAPRSSTIAYTWPNQEDHALAKAAEFDTRLTFLEQALGLDSTTSSDLATQSPAKAILPTLDRLSHQMATLAGSSPASLDAIGQQVHQLTQEAERLESTRKAARAAQDALNESWRAGQHIPDGSTLLGQDTMDSEQTAKINALHGTLGIIESISPLLPSVLDRLRSLRAIHSEAAVASENLKLVEQRQEGMADEIRRWREGLEKVEGAMKEGEGVLSNNMKVVEGWVKDLEERIKRFDR